MTAPVITITDTTKKRISKVDGHDVSVVKFTADQDLAEWEARADGYAVGTGTLVGQSGDAGDVTRLPHWEGADKPYWSKAGNGFWGNPTVLATGEKGSFEVEADELMSGDKNYRITVYGKNKAGEWSTYE